MSSPIPPTPPFPSPASTPAPFISVHPTGNPRLASHTLSGTHHPQALLGNGHPSSLKPLPRDSTELVLYAYVHLTGSLFLLPQPSLARVPALAALQRHKRGPRGGGSMDIGVASPPHSRGHERRSSSIAGSLWGLISSPASAVLSPGHRARAPSYGSSPIFPATHNFADAGAKVTNYGTGGVGLGLGGVSLGLGGVQEGEGWDPEQSLPVFEVPPAMLAVDLNLGPGEERSCECGERYWSLAPHFNALGAHRHVYGETAIQSTPDLQGSLSQVLVSAVRWCVSSDCGCGCWCWRAQQPEQGDEGPDTHLQSRLW